MLVATPVKDAAAYLPHYVELLSQLSYPHHLISVALLESDSVDGTFEHAERELRALHHEFRRVEVHNRDFGFHIPPGMTRWDDGLQLRRRSVLAKSRNHLLSRALRDEEWVLWVDVDVVDYPRDIVQRLLSTGKQIVTPHCVIDYGGPSFDRNAWRDHARLHLHDLRDEGELVPLHAVGGTMLLVRADLHREGLHFPTFRYGAGGALARPHGEIETEGLGILAHDMGCSCWGMPRLEIRHRDG